MSVSQFKKSFTNPILRKLRIERRKTVERQKGQVILLDNINAFIDVIKITYPNIEISTTAASKALEKGRKKAKTLQTSFKRLNKKRYNTIVSRLPEVPAFSKYMLNEDLFIVTSFKTSINAIKKEILNSFVEDNILTEAQKKEVSFKTHKGHGVIGGAVSEVEIASSLAGINEKDLKLLKSNLDSYFKIADVSDIRARQIESLITSYEQVVTKNGKLRANYFSVVSFQVGSENTGVDAQSEKEVKAIWQKFISEYLTPNLMNMEGSSTLKEKLETVLINKIAPKSSKNLKVRVKGNSKAQTKTKGKSSEKGAKESSNVAVRKAGRAKKSRVKKGVASSPLYIIGIINQQLPRTVAKNMGDPRLNYRTGRFASSVQVTDIATTAKGFPSIGYTYDKFPYQTFEPGYRQGSIDRDPRKLIDASIREIAAQFAIGRFYTRRV